MFLFFACFLVFLTLFFPSLFFFCFFIILIHRYGPPNSPMCGFLRFLLLLSTHDWKSDPLCVDLGAYSTTATYTMQNDDGGGGDGNDEMERSPEVNAPARVRMEKYFNLNKVREGKSNSCSMPPMYLLCTADEIRDETEDTPTPDSTKSTKNNTKKRNASVWTPSFTSTTKPSLLELNRTVALAKNALSVIVSGMELNEYWHEIYSTPPETDYDVILHLNSKWLRPSHLKNSHSSSKKKKGKKKIAHLQNYLTIDESKRYANLNNKKGDNNELLIGFDPLHHYVSLLEKTFGHLCCFFVNSLNSEYIGVVYRRSIIDTKKKERKERKKERVKERKKEREKGKRKGDNKQQYQHPFTAAGSRFASPVTVLDGSRSTHVVYDTTAIVEEMVSIGGDFITSVWTK